MNSINFKISTLVSRCSISLLLGLGLTAASVTASAAVIESEFNGTFATADFANPGTNTGIIGDLSAASNDVDIWRFDLTVGQSAFIDIANGPAGDINGFNPIIVLFMENAGLYRPVKANNPLGGTNSFSFTPWESGTYFLTVTAANNSPEDAFGNNQFLFGAWTSEFISGTTFVGYEGDQGFGSSSSFDYNLNLFGNVATTVVPVPAAVWLFASGLLGLIGVSRRSRRIA